MTRGMVRGSALVDAIRALFAQTQPGHGADARVVPLLVLTLPEFAQLAWQQGRPAARRLERLTAQAIESAAARVMRDGDLVAHDEGSEWFAIAMLAPPRDGAFAQSLDARRALERIAATVSLATGRRMETGWWPIASGTEVRDLARTIERALERGARERERYEFLATVGHELRTPLTSIRGYIETLLDDEVDAPTAKRFLEVARNEALRLGRLVDGMLDFSLLDLASPALGAQAVDLREVVRAACEALAPIARDAGIDLHAQTGGLAEARIDADACMHALVNLIENAVKYGRRGGRIMVSLERQDPYVAIIVEDDGPGVPQSERERIFEHRARGSAAGDRRGGGIGLAIVRTIVERVAGSASVGTSPLGGARFMVRLPSARAESTAFSS